MKTQLKNSLSTNKTLLILSLVCILLGVLGCVFSELVIPLILGVLSVIYLFDTKSRHIFSISVSLALLVLNIASILMNYAVSFFAPAAIIMAWLISFAFKKDQSKSDVAYICTVIAAALSLCGYVLFAMKEQGAYTLDAAMEFYSAIIAEFRAVFVKYTTDLYAASGMPSVTTESIEAVFDMQLNMIISYLLIGGFIITGVGCKIFSAIVGRISEDKSAIRSWRFVAPRAYAYFYVILIIASLFASKTDGIFAISVLNLYNVFLIVFAYIGFNVAIEIVKRRAHPRFSILVLVISIICFASFAIQILAALGVLFSVRRTDLGTEQKQP